MHLEPLQLSMLYGRIAVASAALTHSLFATFIVGGALIAAITATIAYRTRQARYERLAHMMAYVLVLTTATISFLGVILVFSLNIFWPRFWHTIFRVMFWPFILEAFLFLGEAVCAYAWYYLWSWSSEADWRWGLHLMFAWGAAACALAAMFMIDITASYMLTPYPADSAWANILNPTMIHLDLHRWFGNLTWAGFALAGLCALGSLRARTPQDRQHYQWAAGYCFTIGFGALLVMPVIGYQYLLNLRYGQPQAFEILMLGKRAWLFDLVAILYSLLLLIGSIYIAKLVRRRAPRSSGYTFLPLSLVTMTVAGIVFMLPYRLDDVPVVSHLVGGINPVGKMQPYKYFAIAFLITFGFSNWLFFLRTFWGPAPSPFPAPEKTSKERSNRMTSHLLILLAICSILIMLTMGWIRETARAWNGYLVYGHISLADEHATYEGTP